MKKRFLAWSLLIVMLLSQLCVPAFAATGGEKAADSRNGVVRILMLDKDGQYHTGTAFGVGTVGEETDIFVTNHHVVFSETEFEDGSKIYHPAVSVWIMKNNSAWNPVTGPDTTQCIPCEVIYSAENRAPDMAILRAAEKPAGRVALPLLADEKELEVGDEVYTLGYPATSDVVEKNDYGSLKVAGVEDVTITSGIVSRFTTAEIWGNTRIIQHNAQINGGNSGGPLLDENGVVVGINTWTFGFVDEDKSYASVRIKYALDALDDLGIEYETASDSGAWLYILLGFGAVAAAVVVVLVILNKKRQAPATPAQQFGKTTPVPSAQTVDTIPRLQCLTGAFAGQRFSIDGTVRMGRDPAKNDLVFPANVQGISGVHCVIMLDGNQVWLKDLGSTYGTFLNGGQRLAAHEAVQLKVGDKIWLGSENEVFVIAPKGGI